MDGPAIGPSRAFSNGNGRLAGRITGGEGKGGGENLIGNEVCPAKRGGTGGTGGIVVTGMLRGGGDKIRRELDGRPISVIEHSVVSFYHSLVTHLNLKNESQKRQVSRRHHCPIDISSAA